jgi:hypothetical protein
MATNSTFATQSIYATQSLYATTSIMATNSTFATQSIYATQSLYATSSTSASYSVTASYAKAGGSGRELLTAARTYYVTSSNGSDSNDGLTSTTPFATVQHAADVAASIDNGGYDVTIQLADGTYTQSVVFNPQTGTGKYILQGNASTTGSVILGGTASLYTIRAMYPGTLVQVQNMKVSAIASPTALSVVQCTMKAMFLGGVGLVIGPVNAGNYQLYSNAGGYLQMQNSYLMQSAGSAASHLFANNQGEVILTGGITVALQGTNTYTTAFAYATNAGAILAATITFSSGSTTCPRYNANLNSFVNTGGGDSYLPGNSAGVTATGGQYA